MSDKILYHLELSGESSKKFTIMLSEKEYKLLKKIERGFEESDESYIPYLSIYPVNTTQND